MSEILIKNNSLNVRQNEDHIMEVVAEDLGCGLEVTDVEVFVQAIDAWVNWKLISGHAFTKIVREAEDILQDYIKENGLDLSLEEQEAIDRENNCKDVSDE